MAHIETIFSGDDRDDLKTVYEDLIEKRGKIAEVHKIQSLNPEALIAQLQKSGLSDRAILDAVQVIAYFNF